MNGVSQRKGMKGAQGSLEGSAGDLMRQRFLGHVQALLCHSDTISDSRTRLLIQARCLDLMSDLEELLGHFELDSYPSFLN